MAAADLLGQRRPHRADAARNFDALLAAARDAFTEFGVDASLEGIAGRAGVGIATLYRNFPTREELIESVYVAEVDAVCRFGDELGDFDPWEAMVAWLRRFITYMGTKSVLIAGLNRESEAFGACRDALRIAGEPLLRRAQEAGSARDDMAIDDVLRLIIGISGVTFKTEDQQERVFRMALDGIRVQDAMPS